MKRITILFAIALSIALFSCNQENAQNNVIDEVLSMDKSAEIAADEAVVTNISDEVMYEIDLYTGDQKKLDQRVKYFARKGAFQMKNWLRYRIGQCPDVTIDSTNAGYPITITLDYGDGTTLKDGKVLSGVIVIELTDSLFVPNAKKEVSYQNFSVDSVQISGKTEVVFTGTSELDKSWKIESDVTFTFPDDFVIHRTSEKERVWVSGLDTPEDPSDDEINNTGWVQVETSDDIVYLKEITEPLVRLGDCKWLVSGEVTLTENGVIISIVNWGDGTCDSIITVTRDGETKEVDIEQRKEDRKNRKVKNK